MSALGWVVAAGSLVASVIAPIAGVLSDRTRSSWGRRRPWVVGSAAVAALSLILLAYQDEIWVVLVLCCVAQAALAVLLSALSALIPDQVPVNQRGRVSALLGLAQPLGAMLATVLVTAVFADVFDGYLILAAVLTGATALFAVLVDEPPNSTAPTGTRVSALDGLRFSALADRDFALSWLGRFLVMLGTTAAVLYFLYYLSGELRYQEISGEPAEAGMPMPIEVRFTAADDIPLSTATGRASAYIAVHLLPEQDYDTMLRAIEPVFAAHDGRPHWGKLHYLSAAELADRYPRFGDFVALRDKVDPSGRFGNPYLDRVLGAAPGFAG